MSKKQDETFIGTHTRMILSDWPAIARLVVKHGKLIKEQAHSTEEAEETSLPNVISQREIEDALEGPFQGFFKQKVTAYSRISRIRLNLVMAEDENLRDRRAKLPDSDKVPESILKNTSIADLNKTQNELDQLTSANEEEWMNLRDECSEEIIEHLNKLDITLSELEIKEFLDPEPISELQERFVTLNIEMPKMPKSEMNLSKYLMLKAHLAIHSALGRQHQPNTQNDVQKLLNKLKANFNAITKDEAELLASQKTATNELIAHLSY